MTDYLKLAREARERANALPAEYVDEGEHEQASALAGVMIADGDSTEHMRMARVLLALDMRLAEVVTDVPALCDAIEAQAAELQQAKLRLKMTEDYTITGLEERLSEQEREREQLVGEVARLGGMLQAQAREIERLMAKLYPAMPTVEADTVTVRHVVGVRHVAKDEP